MKGSLLLEVKSRERSSRSHSHSSHPTSRSRHSYDNSDYFSRDLIHGPPLPRGFERKTTPHGQVYWLNRSTGESTWHDPRYRPVRQQPRSGTGPLPAGWEQRETHTGRTYYVNHQDRTTQFTDPRLESQNIPQKSPTPRDESLPKKLHSLRTELLRKFDNLRNREVAVKVKVQRDDVFRSSFDSISRIPKAHIHKRLLIKVS